MPSLYRAFMDRHGNRFGVAVVVLAIFAVGGSWLLAGSPHEIAGTLELDNWRSGFRIDQECKGSGGYSDIGAGTTVVVRDGAGVMLATTTLGPGKPGAPFAAGHLSETCTFDFELVDVPRADFYQVEVSNRGALSYSYADLERSGWFVAVSLGS